MNEKKREPNDCRNCVFGNLWREKYTNVKCNRTPYARIKHNPQLQCEYHCRPETPLSWRIRMGDKLIEQEYAKHDV